MSLNYIFVYGMIIINCKLYSRIYYLGYKLNRLFVLDKLFICERIIYCLLYICVQYIVCKLQKFINKPLQLFAAPWAAARKSLFPHKIYSRPCLLLERNISLCMSMLIIPLYTKYTPGLVFFLREIFLFACPCLSFLFIQKNIPGLVFFSKKYFFSHDFVIHSFKYIIYSQPCLLFEENISLSISSVFRCFVCFSRKYFFLHNLVVWQSWILMPHWQLYYIHLARR